MQLARLQKTRHKYMDMYTDDLISREELKDKIGGMRKEIERLDNELKMVSYNLTKGQQLENILNSTFRRIEDITDVREMNNLQLKRINPSLAQEARKVLDMNKSERHIRGGMATREKYLHQHLRHM